MDWEGSFQFADEQGILGLMADDRWHTDLTDHTDFESHAEITKSTERESGRPDYDLMLE